MLARHPGVGKLSLTGSSEVGKSIWPQPQSGLCPSPGVRREESPNRFPDADDDQVAQSVINGMRFTRQGQSCTAGSRLFLHASIFDSFMDRLVKNSALSRSAIPLMRQRIWEPSSIECSLKRCAYVKDGLGQKESRLLMEAFRPKRALSPRVILWNPRYSLISRMSGGLHGKRSSVRCSSLSHGKGRGGDPNGQR